AIPRRKPILWSTMQSVVPAAWTFTRTAARLASSSRPRPEPGSSSSSSSGRHIRPMAMPSIFSSPYERLPASWRMAAVRSQRASTSSTSSRSVASVARPPPRSSTTRRAPSRRFSARWVATKTLSSTESSAKTWGLWNVLTRPREATSSGRKSPMSSPFHSTVPLLAGVSRAITLRSVVFPEPLGPMMPTTSPRAIANDTLETAIRPLKRLVTPCTSSSTPASDRTGDSRRTPSPPRGERSDDPAGHDEDRKDQDGAVEHRPQLGAQVDDVGQPGEDERSDDRPGQRALAAEQHHGQDLHRLVDREVAGIDVPRVVAVEAAGEG